jgi:hypothetical protein
MVNATIDNAPVSIQLDAGQATTVPTNEVWKVTISVFGRRGSGPWYKAVTINNSPVLGIVSTDGNLETSNSPTGDFVLAGGDTISDIDDLAADDGIAIQGFVVNN